MAPQSGNAETGTSTGSIARVIRGTTAAAAIGYLLDLVLIPLVVRRIGAPTYGIWAAGASILSFAALADVGIRSEVARRVAAALGSGDRDELRRAVHTGTSILAALAVPIAIVGWLAAPALRSFLLPGGGAGESNAELDLFLRLVIVAGATTVVLNGYFGVLRGVQRADVEARAALVGSLVGAGVTLGAAMAGAGLWALAAGWAVQTSTQMLWQWLRTRALVPDISFRLIRVGPSMLRPFLTLSGFVLLAQVSDVIDTQWDKLQLSHFVGPATVASFQLGTVLVLQAKALAVMPITPLLSAMSELAARRADEARWIYERLEGATFALAATVLSAAFAFGPAFVRLWLGPDFEQAGHVVRLLLIAVAINVYAVPRGIRAFSEKAHRLPGLSALANVVVNGVLSVVLTWRIGLDGALYGSIAGNLAGTVVFLALMRRREGADWRWPSPKALMAGAVLGFLLTLAHAGDITAWPLLLGGAALYLVASGPLFCLLEGVSLRALRRAVRA